MGVLALAWRDGRASRSAPERPEADDASSKRIRLEAVPLALGALGVVALLWAATFTAANLSSGQARSRSKRATPKRD